jgi:hypothetical protein
MLIPEMNVRAFLKKQLGDRQIPKSGGLHKYRLLSIITFVNMGTLLEERLNLLQIAFFNRCREVAKSRINFEGSYRRK